MSTTSLAGFDKTAKQVIKEMQAHGWTGRVSSKGHWIGRAPDGVATIAVGRNLSAPNRARQNTLAEWARWLAANDEASTDIMVKSVEADLEGDVVAAGVLRNGAARRLTTATAAQVAESAAVHRDSDVVLSLDEVDGPVPITVLRDGVPLRSVVRSEPWHAHKAPSPTGGTKYRSEAVVEREWSDGVVDYVCALEDCGYTSFVARSVSSHYAAHTRAGETRPASGAADVDLVPGFDYTEHLTTREYQPTDRLVEALAEFLSASEYDRPMSPEDLARLFLTWAHERPDIEHVERESRALTDEEIVGRIRVLVGQPLVREVEEATARAVEAEARAAAAVAERDEIAARLVKVERDLAAAKEIFEGIGK